MKEIFIDECYTSSQCSIIVGDGQYMTAYAHDPDTAWCGHRTGTTLVDGAWTMRDKIIYVDRGGNYTFYSDNQASRYMMVCTK